MASGDNMKKVTLYTTDYCGYCRAAKHLLEQQIVPFTEIDVTNDSEKRQWLVNTTGQRTVPQIFLGDEPIGGYTELAELVKGGSLQDKLRA
jgi:glutaredoxin 3